MKLNKDKVVAIALAGFVIGFAGYSLYELVHLFSRITAEFSVGISGLVQE